MFVRDLCGNKFYVRENTLDGYIIKEQNTYFKHICPTPEDVWLDIGANIGAFSLRICNFVKKVIAFEPDVKNFELLKYNIELNKIRNIQAIQKAIIGSTETKRVFFLNNKKNMGGHSFLVKRGRIPITVECLNINDVLKEYGNVKIKMDIEGTEHEVIKAIDCFSNINEMVLEFHFNILCRKGDKSKYWETINLLKRHFSTVKYNVLPKKNWHTVIHATNKG